MKTAFFSLLALILLYLVLNKNLTPPGKTGVTDGKLSKLPNSPNGVSTQSEDPDFAVDPLPFGKSLDHSYTAVKEALREYGNVLILSEQEHYLHGVHTTKIFRFKDDLEFSFDTTKKIIHFRSASRVGYSDFGKNRRRYRSITKLYLARINDELSQ